MQTATIKIEHNGKRIVNLMSRFGAGSKDTMCTTLKPGPRTDTLTFDMGNRLDAAKYFGLRKMLETEKLGDGKPTMQAVLLKSGDLKVTFDGPAVPAATPTTDKPATGGAKKA